MKFNVKYALNLSNANATWINEAVRRLRKQGKLAKDGEDNCSNITPEGCKCIIGGMLSKKELDEVVRNNLQGYSVNGLAQHFFGATFAPVWLSEFQRCHDHAMNMKDFEKRIKVYAKNHNIEITPKD